MSFWSTEKILQKQVFTELVKPFDLNRLKHGAYELALGHEALITSEPTGLKAKLENGAQVLIPPGQFGILLTEEIVSIPDNAIGFISIRFSIKCQGLVNVSGFHVDPGFAGHLKFAVYNAGSQSIFLTRGDRVFMIWFSDLSEATRDLYDGEHSNQNGITSQDARLLHGELASPAALKKQIEELRSTIDQKVVTLGDEQKRQVSTLEDKLEQRIRSLDDKIGTWRTFTITFFSAITVLILGTILSLVLGLFAKLFPSSPAQTNPVLHEAHPLDSTKDSNSENPATNRNTNPTDTEDRGGSINPTPRR